MPVNRPSYVVLDANILIRDFWMNGESFSYLMEHHFLDHHPVIPKVAYLEAKKHLSARAQDLLANVREDGSRSEGNLQRLLRLFNYKKKRSNPEWDVDKLISRWERHIKKILSLHKGKILPTPNIDLETITERSIARRKPFSLGDRGFRDTLIWLSVLELATQDAQVSFITANTQDFFRQDSHEPHSEILEEASSKLHPDWQMLFHRSVDEFIVKFDSDRSTSAEALRRALISDTLAGFCIWYWLEENLEKLLSENELDGVSWAGLPYDAEDPQLSFVEEIVSLDIPRLTHLRDETYRLYCDFTFIGNFLCDIGMARVEDIVSAKQILWKDESDGYWTRAEIRSAASFIARIDFDAKKKTVVSTAICPLQHWDDYDETISEMEAEKTLDDEVAQQT